MKYLCYACLMAVILAACESSKVPKEFIQPDQLSDILYDMHLADGYISSVPGQDSARKVSAAWYNGIYKRYHVDSALYSRSLDYYYKEPELLSGVYNKVTERLKKVKEVEDKAEEKRKKIREDKVKKLKQDSLDRVKKGLKPLKTDSAKKVR